MAIHHEGREAMASPDVRTKGLQYVDFELLLANPYNPRRLFDELPLDVLKDSIRAVGILVPLLVYMKESDKRFVILDGERRWRCVKELVSEYPDEAERWRDVPVNVVDEPAMVSNILMMFNIHNIREPWELMPTAIKLDVLMRELKENDPKRLFELTGLSVHQIRRCKILLTFDSKYQEMMMAEDPGLRAKSDFFIELYSVLNLVEKNLPTVTKTYGRIAMIDRFLEKFQNGEIKNVVDFREVADVVRAAKKGSVTIEQATEAILDLLERPGAQISGLTVKRIRPPKELDQLTSSVEDVERLVSKLEIGTEVERERLLEVVDRLKKLLARLDEIIGGLE